MTMAEQGRPDAGAGLRLHLLGEFRVWVGPSPVDPAAWRNRRKASGLVKLLALAPRHLLHREQAMAALWPDLAPTAAYNLHSALYVARRALEPALVSAAASTYLRLEGEIVTLCAGVPLWIDVEAFETTLAAARHAADPVLYQAALAHYRGDLLPDDTDAEWAARRRDALRWTYLGALEEYARLLAAAGDIASATETLERAFATDPTFEEGHAALMRLYARTRRRGRALRQYQLLAAALERDLDARPSEAVERLYHAIRDGRFPPAADAAPGAARAARPPSPRPGGAAHTRPRSKPAGAALAGPIGTADGGTNDPAPAGAAPAAGQAALPSGTVTFLFTDVEGSTRLWEDRPAAMATALARHDALVRSALEHHDGAVFKTVGDAFCAAFADAGAALAAAVALQRELTREPWPIAGGLRVRVALHTGPAQPKGGDYLGPPLNRVHRLLEAAHGGQVLLSGATEQILRGALPPDVLLRDLGRYHLRDLSEPERVFQVMAPGLRAEFPPLRGGGSPPTNLPAPTTALIGREREVAAVAARLRQPEVRLLTVVGPPGIGKTRLALEAARALLPDLPDGVFFVALAVIEEPHLVLPTIARTLGLREPVGRSLAEHLRDHLRGKRLLLCLDNFEQVAAAAPEIGELLAGVPDLKVLATSREALRLYGEHEFALEPLPLPAPAELADPVSPEALLTFPAVRLFVERAGAARGDFALTAANAEAVVAICRHLDGLPLAIELAAARVKLLAPQQILARLAEPVHELEAARTALDLLASSLRDRPVRQQTLRAAIDWSYRLLTPAEQTLFGRLAVFAGGWTLEAAEVVCDAGLDTFDGIASLLDKSLVRQTERPELEGEGDGPRFAMLATIREYALELLAASGEDAALRARHAGWYADLAETAERDVRGPAARAWLDRLEREGNNLRAALRWSITRGERELALRLGAGLWTFWWQRGDMREGSRWLDAVLSLDAAGGAQRAGTSGPPPELGVAALRLTALRGRTCRAAAVLAWAQGYAERAATLAEEGVALLRRIDDRAGIADALNCLGLALHGQNAFERAAAAFEEALAILRPAGDEARLARVLHNLARVKRFQGSYAEATRLYRDALALQETLGDRLGVGLALNNLGRLAHDQGEVATARELLEASLDHFRALDNHLQIALSLNHLGEVLVEGGEVERAEAVCRESLRLRRAHGDLFGVAQSLGTLGTIARAARDVEQAQARYTESLALYAELRDQRGQADCLDDLAALALDRGDAELAARLGGAAEALRERSGARRSHARLELFQALTTRLRDRLGGAAFEAAWEEGYSEPLERWITRLGSRHSGPPRGGAR